jgi:hypothetical protein
MSIFPLLLGRWQLSEPWSAHEQRRAILMQEITGILM